jgi:hypothetical protein
MAIGNSDLNDSAPSLPSTIGERKPIGWLGWVLFAILVLLYSDFATERLLGHPVADTLLGTSLLTGGAVAYFRKRRGARAWRGFFLGSALGYLGLVAIAVICGAIAHLR